MRATTFTELRRNLASELDRVTDDREPVFVTRGRGKPPVVVISAEDFGSYDETAYLLGSPENTKRLREAIAELEGGGGTLTSDPGGGAGIKTANHLSWSLDLR